MSALWGCTRTRKLGLRRAKLAWKTAASGGPADARVDSRNFNRAVQTGNMVGKPIVAATFTIDAAPWPASRGFSTSPSRDFDASPHELPRPRVGTYADTKRRMVRERNAPLDRVGLACCGAQPCGGDRQGSGPREEAEGTRAQGPNAAGSPGVGREPSAGRTGPRSAVRSPEPGCATQHASSTQNQADLRGPPYVRLSLFGGGLGGDPDPLKRLEIGGQLTGPRRDVVLRQEEAEDVDVGFRRQAAGILLRHRRADLDQHVSQ